uniref:HAUS augmin-like complex subunit 5 isoform X1 n=2 Tax=Myxine glutinosa TaxID=7769 RepID=UPI00358ED8FE
MGQTDLCMPYLAGSSTPLKIAVSNASSHPGFMFQMSEVASAAHDLKLASQIRLWAEAEFSQADSRFDLPSQLTDSELSAACRGNAADIWGFLVERVRNASKVTWLRGNLAVLGWQRKVPEHVHGDHKTEMLVRLERAQMEVHHAAEALHRAEAEMFTVETEVEAAKSGIEESRCDLTLLSLLCRHLVCGRVKLEAESFQLGNRFRRLEMANGDREVVVQGTADGSSAVRQVCAVQSSVALGEGKHRIGDPCQVTVEAAEMCNLSNGILTSLSKKVNKQARKLDKPFFHSEKEKLMSDKSSPNAAFRSLCIANVSNSIAKVVSFSKLRMLESSLHAVIQLDNCNNEGEVKTTANQLFVKELELVRTQAELVAMRLEVEELGALLKGSRMELAHLFHMQRHVEEGRHNLELNLSRITALFKYSSASGVQLMEQCGMTAKFAETEVGPGFSHLGNEVQCFRGTAAWERNALETWHRTCFALGMPTLNIGWIPAEGLSSPKSSEVLNLRPELRKALEKAFGYRSYRSIEDLVQAAASTKTRVFDLQAILKREAGAKDTPTTDIVTSALALASRSREFQVDTSKSLGLILEREVERCSEAKRLNEEARSVANSAREQPAEAVLASLHDGFAEWLRRWDAAVTKETE